MTLDILQKEMIAAMKAKDKARKMLLLVLLPQLKKLELMLVAAIIFQKIWLIMFS